MQVPPKGLAAACEDVDVPTKALELKPPLQDKHLSSRLFAAISPGNTTPTNSIQGFLPLSERKRTKVERTS